MYVSHYNKSSNPQDLIGVIQKNGFAVLVTAPGGVPHASHIPLVISSDHKKLLGHVAKANKQWKDFEQSIPTLAIFSGPHTYISSSWYDHENVPTWNYISVHVYGTPKIMSHDELLESLKTLVNKYEKDSKSPVSVEKMSQKFLNAEMKGIVGFEIAIDRIEAAYKLSQNRDDKNFKRITSELEDRGDSNSLEIANAMKELRKLD